MRVLIGMMTFAIALVACQESDTISDFTGNEVTYALQQASSYNISGIVTFKEKKDNSTMIIVDLTGTDGDVKLPVHLHRGELSTPGAEVAALLNPVLGSTGRSETHFTQLADETKLTYSEIVKMEASIKIHLSDIGPERDIVLAGGNIGSLASTAAINGRKGVGVCKSE